MLGLGAEWFWNALEKPFLVQDMALVLPSASAGELPPWADALAEGKGTAAQSAGNLTACLSPSQASASAFLGQIPPFCDLSHIISISLFFPQPTMA